MGSQQKGAGNPRNCLRDSQETLLPEVAPSFGKSVTVWIRWLMTRPALTDLLTGQVQIYLR
jgi:hypothetical protein